jgi:hypothetical protein
MDAISLEHAAADPEPRYVVIAKDQPEYIPLPALVYTDGKVLTEWRFTEEEREAITRGENLRLWVWVFPTVCAHCGEVTPGKLQPIALEVTNEQQTC